MKNLLEMFNSHYKSYIDLMEYCARDDISESERLNALTRANLAASGGTFIGIAILINFNLIPMIQMPEEFNSSSDQNLDDLASAESLGL